MTNIKRTNAKILFVLTAVSVVLSLFIPVGTVADSGVTVISKWTFTSAVYEDVPVGNKTNAKEETDSVKVIAASGGLNVGKDKLVRNHANTPPDKIYPKGDFKSSDYDNTNSMKHMALKDKTSGWLMTAGWSNDENYVYLELDTTGYDNLILKYQIRASTSSTPSALKMQYSFDNKAWRNFSTEVSTRGNGGSTNTAVDREEHLPTSAYDKPKVYIRWFGKYGSTSGMIEFKDIELIQSDAANPAPEDPEPETTFTHITVTIGATPAELAFSWFTPKDYTPKKAILQYVKAADLSGGKTMPSNPTEVTGVNAAGSPMYDTNKARVTGLQPDTEYAYRVGDGTDWSNIYRLKTQNPNSYTAMVVADPQLDGKAANVESWQRTMKTATGENAYAFILSAGDHMNECNNPDLADEYKAPTELMSYPVASCYGNHDHNFDSSIPDKNTRYLTLMNEWPATAKAVNDGSRHGYDYYFVYGNTLYIVLDSNTKDTAKHDPIMQTAIAAHPDATWRVLMYHHDIFGGGSHANPERDDGSAGDAYLRQPEWSSFVSKYSIDVVFNGHDHVYARSKLMINTTPQNTQMTASFGAALDQKNPGVVVAPTGTQYMALGTASNKFSYDPVAQSWHAYANPTPKKNLTAQFTNLKIDGDTLSLETYSVLSLGKIELLDSITFRKKANKDDLRTLVSGAKASNDNSADFRAAITAAEEVLADSSASAEQIHNAFVSIYSSFKGTHGNTTTEPAKTTAPPPKTTTSPSTTTAPLKITTASSPTTAPSAATSESSSATTATKPDDDFILGRVISKDNEVSIFDALEILKCLVGMENKATDNPAALITKDSQDRNEPSIFDALEILKKLVNMDNLIDRPVMKS